MTERGCRFCVAPLVQRDGEPDDRFALRCFCDKTCKYNFARLAQKEKREMARAARDARATASVVMDFAPHEIVPRDGGYMTRIDRSLPERSLIGCSAAWAAAGGEA